MQRPSPGPHIPPCGLASVFAPKASPITPGPGAESHGPQHHQCLLTRCCAQAQARVARALR